MEKYKPIKRSKAFVEFSKDHHFGLLLIWQIRLRSKVVFHPPWNQEIISQEGLDFLNR